MEEDAQSELLSATQVVEAQPLSERAKGFEHLYEKLLNELQRSDSDI